MAAVGFEPTPPQRLVPKTSALDHSATLPATGGIRTHAPQRLVPKTSALDHSATLPTFVHSVGFEPTPPKRLVPKTSALDRSATLPATDIWQRWDSNPRLSKRLVPKTSALDRSATLPATRWDSNPRLRRDWCLKTSALDRSATLPATDIWQRWDSNPRLSKRLVPKTSALDRSATLPATISGSGGIRTHASEETGALNQRLRPLGHATGDAVGFEPTPPRRDWCLKTSALDRSATLPTTDIWQRWDSNPRLRRDWCLKTSALDRSATLRRRRRLISGSGGIRTHASEETGALNQRLRPLGHATGDGLISGSGGIRTHASEETGALNQRLRPLGHATGGDGLCIVSKRKIYIPNKTALTKIKFKIKPIKDIWQRWDSNPRLRRDWCLKNQRLRPLGPRYRRRISGSGGIRTHASEETGALNQRLRPLGHATGDGYLAAVGFEPTPPKRLVPKTSALDRSATLPATRWDSNPRLLEETGALNQRLRPLGHATGDGLISGSGGIRTHASEETGALNQRLRPLGHATGDGLISGSGGIRTHASEETGALNQRLRPLGHATGDGLCIVSD
ncbi:uncharacterized protein CEXT_329061 [Caerostris extrusa]|uniref:Uncharacterized protein n=1 Tax=Caerostris extrusa TaxID=172846 RepID=A0AAV4QT90_CAEEX|nr:uncharacterized protein CEXT_329061 [Caerostris extrusa]